MTVASDIHHGMRTAPARDLPVGSRTQARAVARAARATAPEHGSPPGCCRSPGCWSTSRWPIWTGRTTTWSPSRTPRRPAGSPGAGAVRRPAGQRLRAGAAGGVRAPGSARASSSGWCRPSRCCPPEVAELARAVADRYAGSVADVLRLAVPPRHAKAEGEPVSRAGGRRDRAPRVRRRGRRRAWRASAVRGVGMQRPVRGRLAATADDPGRSALPGRRRTSGPAIRDRRARPGAVWQALPGEDWPARLAEAGCGRRRPPASARC